MAKSNDFETMSVHRGRAEGRSDGSRALLSVVHPPELHLEIELGADATIVGRMPPASGATLAHTTVSRQHFEVSWNARANQHELFDLGSRNGLSVDRSPVPDDGCALGPNSIVQAGDVVLVYEPRLDSPGDDGAISRDAIPGRAAAMQRLRAMMARAAPDTSPVLVTGETGTGKEWVAREIHRASGRRGKLVALNCAALSPQLIESQLFGHVKGAFTGATDAQPGYFRSAEGGTLFLDEIGELPLDLQPKLLRVLQDSEVQSIGSTSTTRVDVRIIAATNRDLVAEVGGGTFRRDLYARLAMWELSVPSLRERRVDILAWVERLYQHWCTQRSLTAAAPVLSPKAAVALVCYDWPDNLRGVDRLVHQLFTGQVRARIIEPADLPGWLSVQAGDRIAPDPEAPRKTGVQSKRRPAPPREELEAALDRFDGNISEVAKHFGRARKQIYRWIEAFGLDRD